MKPNLAALSDFGNATETPGGCTFRGHRADRPPALAWLRKQPAFDLPVAGGFDELPVALTADAWSRTWRSDVVATADARVIESRHGLRLLTQPADATHARVTIPDGRRGDAVLPGVLGDVAARYDDATSDWVALQLEYAK
ncbi:hypothetical protein BamIOP4010DRAFT_3115 [Burkholderia ambifaria IOP40-10]|jgi:hypothetical protein|uniref:Uncharacterized protein n=1 Tax=Burkholderia ambifaria IOP40-10 TaxID=396596 RepID=B1FGF5_9BURK|nr:hypothetical protein BamIOP4010DRAFT_3115 [Burkholderia ambifaria IOP40-10]